MLYCEAFVVVSPPAWISTSDRSLQCFVEERYKEREREISSLALISSQTSFSGLITFSGLEKGERRKVRFPTGQLNLPTLSIQPVKLMTGYTNLTNPVVHICKFLWSGQVRPVQFLTRVQPADIGLPTGNERNYAAARHNWARHIGWEDH